jgi:choline dehydrogenase-like flavoprotein
VTSVVAESGCFISSDGSGRPDIQMHVLPAYVVNAARTKIDGHGFTINSCVLRPKSRGEVTLASNNPADVPIIDPHYHEEHYDRQMAVTSIRKAREILSQSEMNKYIARERFPGGDARTDEEILAYVRQYASVDYHPVGTCRMGRDERSVVDHELRVHGLEGLRVADASIMPLLNSGNTNAPSIMIGEKCAAMIRGEAPLRAGIGLPDAASDPASTRPITAAREASMVR